MDNSISYLAVSMAMQFIITMGVASSFFSFGCVRLRKDRDQWGARLILQGLVFCVLRDGLFVYCWAMLSKKISMSCSSLVVCGVLTVSPVKWTTFRFLIRKAIVTNSFGRKLGWHCSPIQPLTFLTLSHVITVALSLILRDQILTMDEQHQTCHAVGNSILWILPVFAAVVEILMHLGGFLVFIGPLVFQSSEEDPSDGITFVLQREFSNLMTRNVASLLCGIMSALLICFSATQVLTLGYSVVSGSQLVLVSMSGWADTASMFISTYGAWHWKKNSSSSQLKTFPDRKLRTSERQSSVNRVSDLCQA